MCVTSSPAILGKTRMFTYAASPNRHVTAYQNVGESFSQTGPNCMLLHFPASGELSMVHAALHGSQSVMDDVTAGLEPLEYIPVMRSGGSKGMTFHAPVVVEYGDYTCVIAQSAQTIPEALDRVREDRRPRWTREFQALAAWYDENYPGWAFELSCWDGKVEPSHPIVVEYTPLDPNVLFAPGIDEHSGGTPKIGSPGRRDMKVAFGVQGVDLAHMCRLTEIPPHTSWIPDSVAGFYDNQRQGRNVDYRVSVDGLRSGANGAALYELATAS